MLRFPPKAILVAFDLSEVSVAAYEWAIDWAKRYQAKIEVLYVEDLLPPVTWEFSSSRLTPGVRRKILAHIRSKVGPKPAVTIIEGEPAPTLLRRIRAKKPDLVVMGTHARQGLERAWIGSVAESVVRLSPVPVLTVRGGKPKAIKSVLSPVNLTDYSEYGFVFAAGMAAAAGARLTAFYAGEPGGLANPQFRLNNLVARLPQKVRDVCRPEVKVREGKPTVEILNEAGGHDLLVLVARRHSLLKEMVLGTTVERVLRHSPIPVLAVPAPAARFKWDKWLLAAEPQPVRALASQGVRLNKPQA